MITKFLSSREKKTKMNHDVLTISYDYLANFKQLKRKKNFDTLINDRRTNFSIQFLFPYWVLFWILFFSKKKTEKKCGRNDNTSRI